MDSMDDNMDNMEKQNRFVHKSVLLSESIEALAIKPDGIYVDGTAGGGGHSYEIASRLTTGRLIAVDTDPDAIRAAGERLAPFKERVTLLNANFADMKNELHSIGVSSVDGILLDLGVSSYQFDTPSRGFSYNFDAPLDMRMSQKGPTAADLINSADYATLTRILREYGEEQSAARIASRIVSAREQKPIETTFELVELIKAGIPAAVRRHGPHPARKTFQALRIAVNGELEALGRLLDDAQSMLSVGGRLAVITFHSLEDRMVKQRFIGWAQGCICPPDCPVCICGHKPEVKILYKRGIEPSAAEIEENQRSRSARLRVAEKL
jgi:16S rRNA (cytosine1402-N4)-methyltransferase